MATIATIASDDPQFSILLAAIGFIDAEKGTTYAATLGDDTQDLTVFAPNNAAFIQLATDTGFTGDTTDEAAVITHLTTLGPDTLETVVTYHVSPGSQLAADIAASGTVATLQGESIDAGELPTLGDLEPDLIDPSLIATDIIADNGVVHVIDRVLLPIDLPGNDAPTITEIVLTSGTGFDTDSSDFDILREAVVAADLADLLNDPNVDLTVFAPNDGAFVGLSQTLGYDGDDEAGALTYLLDALRLLNGGGDPIDLLTTVLNYHVAGQSLQLSQVTDAGSVQTVQGGVLTVDGTSLVDADPDVPNPTLVATDIQAANGIVHVLDGVLLPVDVLQSNGADDVDFVIADDGRNFISTGADNDLIDAKDGGDVISAGSGDDLVLAGGGNDRVFGGSGKDTIKGESGADILLGGGGRDDISGGRGNDKILGGGNHDIIKAGKGDDFVFGGRGDDYLSGGRGDDKILGGQGDDTINGGSGDDFLNGGHGQDTFVFDETSGNDTIIGFNFHDDKIDLSKFDFEDFHDIEHMIDRSFLKTTIHLDGVEIELIGFGQTALDADNFIF
ncbi:MAG: fasciclin domain-containing protein [Pseudomonadota bacterium]